MRNWATQISTKEHFRWRGQQVQRPWGGSIPGMSEHHQGGWWVLERIRDEIRGSRYFTDQGKGNEKPTESFELRSDKIWFTIERERWLLWEQTIGRTGVEAWRAVERKAISKQPGEKWEMRVSYYGGSNGRSEISGWVGWGCAKRQK